MAKESTFKRIVAGKAGAERRKQAKAGKKKTAVKKLEALAKGRIAEMIRAKDRKK